MRTITTLAAFGALLAAACSPQVEEPATPAEPMTEPTPAAALASDQTSLIPAAAIGDMYEIRAADIALAKSQNAEVRRLAEMIKADHTDASNKFKALVPTAAPGVTLPTALDAKHQGLIDQLNAAPAAGFDMAYIDQQIAAHNEAIGVHRGLSANAAAPALAEHSRVVLPKIEAHLRSAEAIKAAM